MCTSQRIVQIIFLYSQHFDEDELDVVLLAAEGSRPTIESFTWVPRNTTSHRPISTILNPDCAIRPLEREIHLSHRHVRRDDDCSRIDFVIFPQFLFFVSFSLTLSESLLNALTAMFGHKQPDKTTSYHGGFESPETEPIDENVRQEIDPDSGVKRGLKNRHLSMMALAGIIGPGLLVGSGGALQNGGPASLLIGFGVIGIIAFSIMQSLGEVTTLYPGGGAFVSLAERFVDKGFAVAVGWVSMNFSLM